MAHVEVAPRNGEFQPILQPHVLLLTPNRNDRIYNCEKCGDCGFYRCSMAGRSSESAIPVQHSHLLDQFDSLLLADHILLLEDVQRLQADYRARTETNLSKARANRNNNESDDQFRGGQPRYEQGLFHTRQHRQL